MKKDFNMTIRKLTVAPIMASAYLLCMLIHRADVFSGIWQWLYYLLFIGLMPLLAYPLQYCCPHFRDKGRHGQRILAMIFAVSGYLLCSIFNFIFSADSRAWVIVLEYLISGALILIFNKGCKLKISGHACGIVGPVALLFYFGLHVQAVVGILLTVPVYISSLKTKRHTLPQLIGGSLVPIAAILILKLIF